jgi:hypothetical protein
MTTEQIENALITQLQTALPQLLVRGFPADFEGFQLTHPVGVILVQYIQSDFSPPGAINIVTQVRTIQFRLILATPNLRAEGAHAGAYGYLDAMRSAVTGFQITGLSKTYPVRERFLGEQQGVWFYEMQINMQDRNQEAL